ncbi:hypothetical protein GMD78_18190 [Ornithinibacillus sp. L9]|uniref:Uncharacterized protein n=1 Tax=Ornithinibacillus caprae TaxID=2678566 RepID=A0A6N8FNC6_9BACI|nr:hypothetical protein [Ornithinibacillus caprae]MUK90306.1 hypothetical protein [Ornithinibacillus caprae]
MTNEALKVLNQIKQIINQMEQQREQNLQPNQKQSIQEQNQEVNLEQRAEQQLQEIQELIQQYQLRNPTNQSTQASAGLDLGQFSSGQTNFQPGRNDFDRI